MSVTHHSLHRRFTVELNQKALNGTGPFNYNMKVGDRGLLEYRDSRVKVSAEQLVIRWKLSVNIVKFQAVPYFFGALGQGLVMW